MSVHEYLSTMREIVNYFMDYIDKLDIIEEEYHNLLKYIYDHQINNNRTKFKSLLYMISYFSNNHKRNPSFFGKIEKILLNIQNDIKRHFSNEEIFNIFKRNKRVLLILFEEKIVEVNYIIYSKIENDSQLVENQYIEYFLPELQKYVSAEMIRNLPTNFYEFDQKRKIGENDFYISKLIQADDIDQFIKFVQENDYSLDSTIHKSIFETNDYLIARKPSLVEYAAFYGSFRIFQFLCSHFAEVNPHIWNYAVHGRNMDIIHILEKCNVAPKDSSLIIEAIRAFHNEIALYLNHSFSSTENENGHAFCFNGLRCYNFIFTRSRYIDGNFFYDACKYDHYIIVESLLSSKSVDVNLLNIFSIFDFMMFFNFYIDLIVFLLSIFFE